MMSESASQISASTYARKLSYVQYHSIVKQLDFLCTTICVFCIIILLFLLAGGRGIHRPLANKKGRFEPPTHTGAEFKAKVST